MSRTNFNPLPGDAGAGTPTPSGGGLLADLRGSGEPAPAELGAPVVPKRRRVSTQTLVLMLVLAASFASLYTMRKQGMASGIAFVPVKLEYEPEKLKPEDARNQQRVMAELARSVAADAAHDEPLRKNPFRMDTGAPMAAAGPAVDPGAEAAKHDEDIRTRFAQLTLNGIMQGPTPLARISGKTFTVSDTVDATFIVQAIHERSVDLMCDGKVYTLQMSDTGSPGGRRPPQPGRK